MAVSKSLQKQYLILGEAVVCGVVQGGCCDLRRRFASEDCKAARGGFGILFVLMGFCDHQHIIGAVIFAQDVWGDIGVLDGGDYPAIDQPKRNANQHGDEDLDPV